MKSQSSLVFTLTPVQGKQVLDYLKKAGCEISKPAYTVFSGKKSGLSATFYESGKFLVQGKGAAEFIEFFLEPEVLGSFQHTSAALPDSHFNPHIGIDESGKGDFFGPLCIAGVFVSAEHVDTLRKIGVTDSKLLSDPQIMKIAAEIKKTCPYHVVQINPQRYNEIYAGFKNLNSLLGWGHATAIEKLAEQTGCKSVLIDQFAGEHVVKTALKRKGLSLALEQRHRGEEDIAVAAASILARNAFVHGLKALSKEVGIELPKGCAAAVVKAARQVLREKGEEELTRICKQHFKTFDQIRGRSDE